jgi:CSLREA domain-containing protein
MKTSSISLRHSLSSLALMVAFAAPGAYAATLAVNTTNDVLSASDGICSLREAVIAINTIGGTPGDCSAVDVYGNNDTITLPAGTYRLALGGLDEVQDAMPADPVVNTTDAAIGVSICSRA